MKTLARAVLSNVVGAHESVSAALAAYAALSRKVATTAPGGPFSPLRAELKPLVDWIVSRAK